MRRFIPLGVLIFAIIPQLAFAAYGLTYSAKTIRASGQYFSLADTTSLSITGDLTLEGWFKFDSVNSQTQRIISKRGAATSILWTYYGTENVMELDFGATGYHQQAYTYDTTGEWIHWAAVFTAAGPTVEFFANGVSLGAAGNNGGLLGSIVDTNDAWQFGGRNGTTELINGKISLVRVWSTTRTEAQILASYCSVLGSTTNLAAEWTLDNVLDDNSGNSNSLTNNNSATFGLDTLATSTCATVASAVADDGDMFILDE